MKRLFLIVCILLPAAVGRAAEGPAGAETPRSDQHVHIAKSPGDLPGYYGRVFAAQFKALPKGYTIRIVMQDRYDPSPNKLIQYLAEIVPLDPEGERDGVEEFHLPFGEGIERSVTWKKGVKDGPEKFYSRSAGQKYLRMEIPWRNGKVEGMKKIFYPNGKPRSVTHYVNDRADGEALGYTERGKLMRRAIMKDGKRDGDMIDYWPETGKPRRIVHYDMGKVEGVVREFYAGGRLKREIPFKNNAMNGTEKQFEADGSLVRTREWKDGEMVGETKGNAKPAP